MKFSEAILKGFEQVNGRQCHGRASEWIDGKPFAYCCFTAASVGSIENLDRALREFKRAWGIGVITLNDDYNMPWEHVYGMAVAAGL